MPLLWLPAFLATSASVPLAALVVRELGGRHRARLFTGLVQTTALAGRWLTPYDPGTGAVAVAGLTGDPLNPRPR